MKKIKSTNPHDRISDFVPDDTPEEEEPDQMDEGPLGGTGSGAATPEEPMDLDEEQDMASKEVNGSDDEEERIGEGGRSANHGVSVPSPAPAPMDG